MERRLDLPSAEGSIMRRFISALVIAVFCTSTSAALAQDSGAKEETKKAGRATKEAAKDTGSAAKHAGKAVVKGTKKAGTAVKDTVTGNTYKATCNDGQTDGSNTQAAVCEHHGGVKVWIKTKS
jgi:hypothetical protein